MRRISLALVALGSLWVSITGATPRPLVAPPADLTRFVGFAQAPLDKPQLTIPDVAVPAPPLELPPLAPAPVGWPLAERPVAPIAPPRGVPCMAAVLPIASQSLECGKERFIKGQYADAAKAFEEALSRGADREFVHQARYWLGEALIKQNQYERADIMLRHVVGDVVRTEWELWAAHTSAWLALRLQDPTRARDGLTRLLSGAVPSSIQGWARHGLALAHYALGQYADAERVWGELAQRGVPPPLSRDHAFWYGEASGRVGNYARAEAELRKFVEGGSAHPLFGTGRVRLGWWTLAGGRGAESAKTFREYLAGPRAPGSMPDVDVAETGVAQALGASGDWNGALDATRALLARRAPSGVPVAARLLRMAVETGKPAPARMLVQELLPRNISPQVRAWLLLMKGDADRLDGNRDDARTQYDLAQKVEPGSILSQHAQLRLARTNFEMREFGQAAADATAILPVAKTPEMRLPALLLQGEAAYNAGNAAIAEAAYRRVLVEFPQYDQAQVVRRSLGWVASKQNRRDEARQLFLEFSRTSTDPAAAADAALLASELAWMAGDVDTARRELDRIVNAYPMHSRTDYARLNRAIAMVRRAQFAEAQPALRDWITRAPFKEQLGRAHFALGVAFLNQAKAGEAEKHFLTAHREGVGAVASLGVGMAALVQGRLEDATRALNEARDQGTAEVVATADYGLGAVALAKGSATEFKQPALAALREAPTGPMAPRLLYALTAISVDEKDWPAALDQAKTLVTQFPKDDAADDALARVGAGAATAQAWPVVYEAYSLLRQKYPASPFIASGAVPLAEAQLKLGRADEARRDLDQVMASPSSPVATDAKAWILLARAREATGERRGAIDAYARAAKEGRTPAAEWMREAQLGQARLLLAEKRWDQARSVLDRLLKNPDPALALEAAFSIGETYRQEGDVLAATEYYMTAGYLAPDSEFGRKGLLAAAQTFAAAKQQDAAAIVYKRLLAQTDLPADVADAARQGLQSIGR